MITPDQAEKLAHDAVEDYINKCGCKTIEDVGHVTMKLLSMTGLALVATQGQDKAVAMVEGVMLHIAKPKFAKSARFEKVTKQ